MTSKVLLDLNSLIFQEDLFALEKAEQRAILNTLKKISQMTWEQVYGDKGLNWEAIQSKASECMYSFRFSQKYRCVATREGDYMRLHTLHVDHDSAYS
jgi:hypothetical protein